MYLIEHIIGLELPAYHQRHEHCAERHCNTLRPAVHEVEEAVVPCLIAPELEHARFAQTVNRDENSLNEDKSGDPKGNLGALRRLARFYALVDEVGSHNLHQGDCGGDSGEDNEQIEDDAEQRTGGTHVVENVLQGDKQETGAAEGYLGIGSAVCDTVCNGCGDDRKTSHNSNEGIGKDDDAGIFDYVILLFKIRAVGDHCAHCKRQGEEHLTACGTENFDKAGVLFDKARLNRVAGDEHELETFRRAGEGECARDNDNEHDKQCGHTDFIELFNTARDAALDYDHADAEEERREYCSAEGSLEHRGEYCAAARGAAETVAEVEAELRHVKRRVLDAVAAEHGIKAHNKEGGDDAQPAEPCKLLGCRLIRRYNAFAGFTTEGKLAAHDYHANENCEGKVNEQERKAAALTHLVGKSPDVAEAHCGAYCRHDEAECASP